MNRDIQPAVRVKIHGEFSDGGIRQRQNPLHPAGGQDAQSRRFIVAAQIEALVEALIPCLDGFGAEQLIQSVPRPDGQPCGKFPVQPAQHPLAGVDLLLVLFPQAGLLPLKLADFRQPHGAQLRG